MDTAQPFGLADITDQVAAVARASGLGAGSLQVFCPHTSCGLALTEYEEGLHSDFESLLEELAPVHDAYRHDDLVARRRNIEPDGRRNGWSHIRALVGTQPSVVLPVVGASLALGQWQRLFLVELDGPRSRRVVLSGWGRPAG